MKTTTCKTRNSTGIAHLEKHAETENVASVPAEFAVMAVTIIPNQATTNAPKQIPVQETSYAPTRPVTEAAPEAWLARFQKAALTAAPKTAITKITTL